MHGAYGRVSDKPCDAFLPLLPACRLGAAAAAAAAVVGVSFLLCMQPAAPPPCARRGSSSSSARRCRHGSSRRRLPRGERRAPRPAAWRHEDARRTLVSGAGLGRTVGGGGSMACRGWWCCCCAAGLGRLSEDNARFLLLAALILLYLLCGAAVFSTIEQPTEAEAHAKWRATFENFSCGHNLNHTELQEFLSEFEGAYLAGIRIGNPRSRWDFSGAFYFVGTVVSTIGKKGKSALRVSEEVGMQQVASLDGALRLPSSGV